jgi:hypothetical protein
MPITDTMQHRRGFMSDQSNVPAPPPPAVRPVQGLIVLGALVVVLVVYVVAMTLLGFKDLWPGLLFVLCWLSFEQGAPARLVPNAAGAAVGLLVGWSMKGFAMWFGAAGIWVFLAVLLVVIYLQIIQWGKTWNNPTTAMVLTIATVPQLQRDFELIPALIVLALTIAYFAGLMALVAAITRRRAAAVQQRQPA